MLLQIMVMDLNNHLMFLEFLIYFHFLSIISENALSPLDFIVAIFAGVFIPLLYIVEVNLYLPCFS